MKVHEIFKSIQGEGLYTGAPTVFVRFAGCTVGCPKCDTTPSWKAVNQLGEKESVGPSEILDHIQSHIDRHPRHICITGGEPLEQRLVELGLFISQATNIFKQSLRVVDLETSGALPIRPLLDLFKLNGPDNRIVSASSNFPTVLSVCMDWKTPSHGKAHSRMIFQNFVELGKHDAIKFVCVDRADLLAGLKFLEELKTHGTHTTAFFHCMDGKPLLWLSRDLSEMNLAPLLSNFDIRFGVQLHKLIGVR